MASPLSIEKLKEAAYKSTGDRHILKLGETDVLEAVARRLDVKGYYPQFDRLFSKPSDVPWKHGEARESLREFLHFVGDGHESYGDMLDSFIDGYLGTRHLDEGQEMETHRLQPFLESQRRPDEVWVEVGAGYTGIGLVHELSKMDKGITYILNDHHRPDAVNAIRRYADRLGMKNVVALRADAGSGEFRELLSEASGGRGISQIRANNVLEYLPDQRKFLAECGELLHPGGKIHLKESFVIGERPLTPEQESSARKAGRRLVERPDGTHILVKYDPREIAAELGFSYRERFVRKDPFLKHYATLGKRDIKKSGPK